MTALGRPGVFVQENTVQQNIALQERSEAVAGFIGALPKGPVAPSLPTFVTSWSAFVKLFGNLDYKYPTSVAVYQFFANGGRDAYIRRTKNSGTTGTASIDLNNSAATAAITIKANSYGTWGNALAVEVLSYGTGRFSIVVYGQPYTTGANARSNILEQFNDLSMSSSDARYAVSIINASSAYVTAVIGTGDPVVDSVVRSLSGGLDGTPATTDVSDALSSFDSINTPSIINAPDLAYVGSTAVVGASYTEANVKAAASNLIKYCEYRGDCFAIIDTPKVTSASDATNYAAAVSLSASTAGSSTQSVTVSAVTPSTPSAGLVTYATSTAHNFVPGATVTIAGVATQVGLHATASTAIASGKKGAVTAAGFVTYTTSAAHNLATGDTVTVTGITGTNGIAYLLPTATAVTVVDSTSFYVTSTVTTSVASNADTTAAKVDVITPIDPTNRLFSGSYPIYTVPTTTSFTIQSVRVGTPVLSTPTASVTTSNSSIPWSGVSATGSNSAVYFPWITIPDSSRATPAATIAVPPGGAVLGQFQATDASRGVFKSPAGYGNRISLAIGLDTPLSNVDLDLLNSSSTAVNAFRQIPGNGIVVMGARTMSNAAATRYINMRRTMIYLKKELTARTNFAVFENNDPYLWNSITNSLNAFLGNFWQQGGLKGSSPSQAFYVKCDGATTSSSDIENGRVNIQVGVALEYPAEFVLITIGQVTGNASVTQG